MNQESVAVLHVDDDQSLRELMKLHLERSDPTLSIISEPTAAAGLEQLDQRSIDCIISDYEMPGMDGLEFLKTVRADHPTLPFILHTGKGSEEIAAKAINAGVDAYYQKEGSAGHYTVLAQQIATFVEKYYAEQRLAYLEEKYHIADGGLREMDQSKVDEHADSVSMAVVEKVANHEGVDPLDLTPLSEAINLEALDALFRPQSSQPDQRPESVTFTYHGHTITIVKNGQVNIDR